MDRLTRGANALAMHRDSLRQAALVINTQIRTSNPSHVSCRIDVLIIGSQRVLSPGIAGPTRATMGAIIASPYLGPESDHE